MLQYVVEAARLLLPGLGCGFLIFSVVQGFAQPWWSLGLLCCVLGVVLNFNLIPIPSKLRTRNKVMHVLERVLPWVTLAMVIITLVVSILR
ncbi:MAG: hypothetical protein IJX84_10380 [Clostridia bacterium]|nr:hypothetical protein [Clostridia bacterium]